MDSHVAKIVSMYRAEQNLTQEEFAAALTELLTDNTLTGAAVSYWESGQRKPQAIFCIRMGMQYGDWRCDLAFDLLAALVPGAYKARGRIGKHVLLGEALGAVEVEA